MPTGWRPKDVSIAYPSQKIKDPKKQLKYDTPNSFSLIIYSWVQLFFALVFMFHLFTVLHLTEPIYNYLYAVFIFTGIFSYTSLLDGSSYAWVAETFKLMLGLSIIFMQEYQWYGMDVYPVLLIILGSFLGSLYFYGENKRNISRLLMN